jgi:type VI secretion system protein ImpK
MAPLRELFADVFAYVLLFEQRTLEGGTQPAYEQVWGDVTARFDQMDAAARRQNIAAQDYQDGRFAVVAWVDETILKHTSWEHHAKWGEMPLQLKYYQMRNAGEEFFERLERLRPEQREVRELYFYCLGLGFSGRYVLDERTLHRIRHEQAQGVAVEDQQAIRQLTPQPYTVSSPPYRPIKVPSSRRWLKVGVVVLIGVPLLLFLVYRFWPSLLPSWPVSFPTAPPVVKSPGVTPRPPRPETPSLANTIEQWLAQHPEMVDCARVTVDNVNERTGVVTLGGRVASEASQTALRESMQTITGVKQVVQQFQLIPRPFCAVLDLLEPIQAHAEAQAYGLTMHLNKEGTPPAYYEGDNLVVDVQTPAAFSSYIYVDYYSSDAYIGHLFPNPQQRQETFEPNHAVTIGALDGPQTWTILPPHGLELVTVIASRTPLFPTPKLEQETADAYLDELRQALNSIEKTDIAATFLFLDNRERP